MNIISSISSYLNSVKQPPAGVFKRVWSLHATDCIEVVVDTYGDVLVNHLVLDPKTRATQSREYITDGDVDPETIKEVIADIRAFIRPDKFCP